MYKYGFELDIFQLEIGSFTDDKRGSRVSEKFYLISSGPLAELGLDPKEQSRPKT